MKGRFLREIKMTKGKAFVLCLVSIMAIYFSAFVLVAVRDKDLALIPIKLCLAALVTITGGYIGFQVANNGVRGKLFNPELYRMENLEQAEGGAEGGKR